ncbi:MAG TPA: hypothetical protein VFV64_07560 [Permianibacter sp.]|nr:hypothetical protein [Permianibacter sp.]
MHTVIYRLLAGLLLIGLIFVGTGNASASELQQRLQRAFALPADGLPGNYYRLIRTDLKTGDVQEWEYWLDFPRHRLLRRGPSSEQWLMAGPNHGWRQLNGQRICLTATEREQALQSLRYHFLYLFTQPTVQLEQVSPTRWQVALPGISAFQIDVDEQDRITTLHFAEGRFGKERDYQQVDGIWWPFIFELGRDGALTSRGEFSAFAIRSVAMELDAADAQRPCQAP